MNNVIELSKEHANMVMRLSKDPKVLLKEATEESMHIEHMLIGLAGDIGELVEAVENCDRENVIEESGDIEFYFRGACVKAGIDPVHRSMENPYTYGHVDSFVKDIQIKISLFVDIFKKKFVFNKAVDPLDLKIAAEELRLALDRFYGFEFITYQEVIEHNMNKLERGKNARYKNGYSDEAAQQRADKQ